MKIQIVKHYSKYDPDFEGEVGFVTVEVPNRTGLFGAKENPVIQKFEEYGQESEQLTNAKAWVEGYIHAMGMMGKSITVEEVSVADDEIDRP